MNIEFDARDIERIAEQVALKLLPLFRSDNGKKRKDNLLTVVDLAEKLGREKSWVYRKVQLGEIPYTKPGKYLQFDPDKIDAWLDNYSVRPSGRDN